MFRSRVNGKTADREFVGFDRLQLVSRVPFDGRAFRIPGDLQRPVGEFDRAGVEEANHTERARDRAAANAADSGQAQVAHLESSYIRHALVILGSRDLTCSPALGYPGFSR